MPARHRSRIFSRLLRFILPLLILSILITSVVLSRTNYAYFEASVTQDYRNIVKSSAGEIHLYLSGSEHSLERLAWILASTKPDAVQEEAALTAYSFQSPDFMSLSLFTPDGVLVREKGTRSVEPHVTLSSTFQNAVRGKSSVSGVMHTEEKLPYVDLAVPVIRLGEVRQVLLGRLNLKSVWEVLDGIRIGATGQVHIMDLEGRLIGHKEMDRVVSDAPAARKDVLARLDASPEAPVEWEEERNGGRFSCVGVVIPNLNWVVVLSQDQREIFAPLHSNVFWAVVLTAGICLGATGLAWRWVRRFLVPIEELHGQVLKIGDGHLDEKVTISSLDEIGDLGAAFNQMTTSLKDHITREIEAAKELSHARNLATLGETSSRVKHEVANLLASLKLAIRLLRAEQTTPQSDLTLAQLERQADRLDAFLKDLLKFARRPEVRPISIPLDAVINDAVFFLREEAEKLGIAIEVAWPPDIPAVLADMRLMHQLFQNLMKNAMEAMGNVDGGRIAVNGRMEGHDLVITVEDNGPGIPPEALQRIFDPFFTTKEKGTGLGLAICKTFVEAHRGRLECASRPGEGTTFRITLPLL